MRNKNIRSTLTKFIPKILALPPSSANVVTEFSRINLNKTKLRNFFVNYLKKRNNICILNSHDFKVAIVHTY